MIFNMAGAAAGGVKYLPLFDGYWNLVLGRDGKSGYAEFYGGGTLTWRGGKIPPFVDVTCIGGGGGHASNTSAGAGGQVVSAFGLALPAEVAVTVGAGGAGGKTSAGYFGAKGGTSSFGELCSAEGGNPGVHGANGPDAGGADILGRTHAAGGAAGTTSTSWRYYGGTSTYGRRNGEDGSSASAGYYGGTGGGGAGGGGGGGSIRKTTIEYNANGGAGGDGLVVMGWGNYHALIGG